MAGRKYCRVNWENTSRLLAGSPLLSLIGEALYTWLPSVYSLQRNQWSTQTGWSRPPSHVAASATSRGEEGMPREVQQHFSHPLGRWYYRRSRPTLHPDFGQMASKVGLLLIDRHKPAWVQSQLPTWDTATTGPPESLSTSIDVRTALGSLDAHEGDLEVEMFTKQFEGARITDSVDTLTLLVQRGCHVDKNLFYRVLKRCIAHKELVLGRRIHSLTIKGGYEGDAFLATQLIRLYAAHGRLADAKRVFANVSTPSSYNWATIIFAYARHGEAAEAIRLYRQMRESSSVQPTDHIYAAVLKACATAQDLASGKEVHAHILASSGKLDIFVQTSLISMYRNCGRLEVARKLFESLPYRDVVTWNALISGYAEQGSGQEAVSLYGRMREEGITLPNTVTFVCLLQACANVGVESLDQGRQLHLQIEELGLQNDVVLGGSLVNMYAKCGSLEDARRVFDKLPARNVVTWTAMIAAYAQYEMGQEALALYHSMQREGITPNSVTLLCLLQACASVGVGALHQGKELHAQIEEQGLHHDVVVGGGLVNMYAKCGSLRDAQSLFDKLPERNVVLWTAIIAGYARQGKGQAALSLYASMQEISLTPLDSVTYVCLLQACACVGVTALYQGKQLHAQIEERRLQNDVVLGGSLVNMYAKCGSLEDARRLFDRLAARNVVTWNVMFAGYVQHEMGEEALSLYTRMQQEGVTPDSVAFVCLLQACASIGVRALSQGKRIHAQIEERGLEDDVVLGGSLVNMYAKCGSLDDARISFSKLPQRDVVTWTAMIAGYTQQGMGEEALSLYSSMKQEGLNSPNSITFVCLLQACASIGVGALHQGKQLHAQIEEQGLQDDVVVGGCLVAMYAKCCSLEDARSMFDRLGDKNVVTWTAMITSYVQQGMVQQALSLYRSMQKEGIMLPDSVTFVCLLQACAITGALPLGKQLHAQIEEDGLQADVVVGAALVNMYAKCGSMCDSQQVFDSLSERSIEAWGALTGGYSRQGDSEVVFDLLERMRQEGILPDGITFVSVLTVCSQTGLVDKGRKYLQAMKSEYGISPSVEHFLCMMDLLGRAGQLDEALKIAKILPPNGLVWLTMLGACQKWKNVKIGEQAFEGAVSVDGKDPSCYVLMSNIYASSQMWDDAREMQARRKQVGAWKEPGQSWWTDMDGVVHTFVVGSRVASCD